MIYSSVAHRTAIVTIKVTIK